jgi:hypothetical protein
MVSYHDCLQDARPDAGQVKHALVLFLAVELSIIHFSKNKLIIPFLCAIFFFFLLAVLKFEPKAL